MNKMKNKTYESGTASEMSLALPPCERASSRNFILSMTLGSMMGGNGRPVITTARPLQSEKSSPSLTWKTKPLIYSPYTPAWHTNIFVYVAQNGMCGTWKKDFKNAIMQGQERTRRDGN